MRLFLDFIEHPTRSVFKVSVIFVDTNLSYLISCDQKCCLNLFSIKRLRVVIVFHIYFFVLAALISLLCVFVFLPQWRGCTILFGSLWFFVRFLLSNWNLAVKFFEIWSYKVIPHHFLGHFFHLIYYVLLFLASAL